MLHIHISISLFAHSRLVNANLRSHLFPFDAKSARFLPSDPLFSCNVLISLFKRSLPQISNMTHVMKRLSLVEHFYVPMFLFDDLSLRKITCVSSHHVQCFLSHNNCQEPTARWCWTYLLFLQISPQNISQPPAPRSLI